MLANGVFFEEFYIAKCLVSLFCVSPVRVILAEIRYYSVNKPITC